MGGQLAHKACVPWPCFPAVDRRLCAPLGGEPTHCGVGVLVEAEEIADDAPVQESAVGVCVREVGGLQLHVTELVEDGLSRAQLFIREGAEVQDGKGIRCTYSDARLAGLLTAGVPPM